MIAFLCPGCRKLFSVKDEFAGRGTALSELQDGIHRAKCSRKRSTERTAESSTVAKRGSSKPSGC